MDSKIELTFAELNALNKLLGQIKTETHLTADELDFFSLSPHIISSFEKIHKEYMNHIRNQVKSGQLKMYEPTRTFNSEDDFLLTDKSYIGDIETRIRNLGQHGKDYIKQLDRIKREDYCDLVFAPFRPTAEQRKKIIEILELVSSK